MLAFSAASVCTAFSLRPFFVSKFLNPSKSNSTSVPCDTVMYHSPVDQWRSASGPLTENVVSADPLVCRLMGGRVKSCDVSLSPDNPDRSISRQIQLYVDVSEDISADIRRFIPRWSNFFAVKLV